MLERVLKRGRRIRLIRRAVTAATVAGIVAAGAAGYAVGASDTVDVLGEGTVDLADATASYHACPGRGVLGEVHRGDRMLLTGVSEDGRWYEVRSPLDLLDRVWVPASVVTPDDSAPLPEVPCGLSDDELVLASGEVLETTTTTTALPGDTTTTTTAPTTTVPGQVTPPPTSPPATTGSTAPTTQPPTTTVPADTSGPAISLVSLSSPKVRVAGAEFCDAPLTTTLAVDVTDPSGVSSVTLRWDPDGPPAGGPPAAQKAMGRSGNRWTAATDSYSFGSGYSYSSSARMHLSVRAVDSKGNVATVTLNANTDPVLYSGQC